MKIIWKEKYEPWFWLTVWLLLALEAFAFAGCGGSSDELPQDAALDDSGNPIVDAAIPQGFTNVPITCTAYSREVRHTATDNTKDVTINYIASTNVAPGDDFIISTCAPAPTPPTCPGGDTCMGSIGPTGADLCAVSRGSGSFLDGKLVITCNVRTEHYSAAGALLSSSQTNNTVTLAVKP